MYQTEGESFNTNQQRADVDHVLFVIHGIGPISGDNHFEDNVKTLRKTIEEVIRSEENTETFNIEVIAIEWRSALHDVVDQRMQRITLKTCPMFRSIGNDYLADVMYYFTNHNGQHIINTIVTALNEKYDDFMKRSPNFSGSFSLLGYSLGGVCSYDILCAQEEDYNIEGRKLYAVDVPKLKFKPRHLFTLGSPVGAVMVQRSQEYDGYKVPKDCTLHNIFHPYDPIAYRIEPLIDERYAQIEPQSIESYTENTSIFRTAFSFPSLPSGLSGIRLSFSLPSILPALSQSGSDSDKEEVCDIADDANATELQVLDIDALCEKFREERPKIQLSYESSWSAEDLDPEKILENTQPTSYSEKEDQTMDITTENSSHTELLDSELTNDRVEITSTATFEDRIRTFRTEDDKTRVTEEVNTTQARCEAVFTEKDGMQVKKCQSDQSKADTEQSKSKEQAEDEPEKPKSDIEQAEPTKQAEAELSENQSEKPKIDIEQTEPKKQAEAELSENQAEDKSEKPKSDIEQAEPTKQAEAELSENQSEKPKTGPELEENAEEVRKEDLLPKPISKKELQKLQEGHRVDRVLQEGMVTSEYIAAMTAHFNYWTNKDAVYYILKQLINEISNDEAGIIPEKSSQEV